MSASATDLVRQAAPAFTTTLSAPLSSSATTFTPTSIAGLPTATGITLTIDYTDANGNLTPNLTETMTGVVSGSSIINLVRGLDGTSPQAHASGAVVNMLITANLWNDFGNAFLAQHTQQGAHGALSAPSLTTTGNVTVGGTLTATGNTTLSNATINNLNITGLVTLPVGTTTSGATITPTANADNFYTVTALATSATIAAPAGSSVDGQSLILRILDNGTSQTLTWNAIYQPIGVTLPTSTTASKLLYVSCKYNGPAAKWDVLSIGRQT